MRRSSIFATTRLARSAEPHAAHVDYALVPGCDVMQLMLEVRAGLGDVAQQIFLLDGVNDSDGHRAGQRAAAEGGSVQAGMDPV
jgi:hypothetical protein